MAKRLLERDLQRAQTEPIRRLGGPLLRRVIDEGVDVFARCNQSAPDGDVNLGIMVPFKHLLEMADGVEVLLDHSAVVASEVLLRSAFEASIGLKYVLAADTDRRALSYVVADLFKRIEWCDAMDPATEHGKRYQAGVGVADKPDYPLPEVAQVREERRGLEELLDTPVFREYAEEYRRLQARRPHPHWYSLFGGPRNLRGLADEVDDLDDYLVLYDEWSRTTHATALSGQLGSEGEKATIRVIRAPDGIQQRYVFAIALVLDAMRRVLEYYRPGELLRYATWFKETIQGPLDELESIETD